MKNEVIKQISDSITLKKSILEDESLLEDICKVCESIIEAYKKGGKVIIFGNGGSAADAQHIAAEFVGRFKLERKSLPAIALTTDTSILTAVGNDYGYDRIFERQVEAFATEADVVIGISTSGNSLNITKALIKASEQGAMTVGLLGKTGGENAKHSDVSIIVKTNDTPRIQECHIMIGHIICDIVERKLFKGDI